MLFFVVTARSQLYYTKSEFFCLLSIGKPLPNHATMAWFYYTNIAVQSGTTADLFLGDELAEGGTLYETGASKVDFGALSTAVSDIGLNSDVLIIDELPAKKLIEGKSNLACAPLYYQGAEGENDEAAIDTYAICVTKGQDELLNAINEVLAELGKDGIQALVNKHLGL
ncbi:MAG: transporter substrate-binding domain-containing protein [Clostridiales bacterium]|nr:transporter substrate-binding domain-containing protein [Clostridiales bacterium]